MRIFFTRKTLIIVGIIFLGYLFLSFLIQDRNNQSSSVRQKPLIPTEALLPTVEPTLDPAKYYTEEYKESTRQIAEKDKELIQKEKSVAGLINKTPYLGNNFSIYFDLDQNSFIVYFREANLAEASNELNAFLRQNGIPDRSWIRNLKIFLK